MPSLKRVPVPKPSGLSQYVRDEASLIVLGKSLFWDMQLGSDGQTACATCHFHAGADHRQSNQLSNPSGTFVPNQRLAAADFPFHQLADPTKQSSPVVRTSSQRAGSAGMFARSYGGLLAGLPFDEGSDVADARFRVGSLNVRQVGDRNAPSVLNAVFNFRNFWDGRASETFNGATPFGVSDEAAVVLSSAGGTLKTEKVRLDKSSLASQSVGPALNLAEMSYDTRTWASIGKKMLVLRPLAKQRIASDDSVLGRFANASASGFANRITYLDLLKAAFQNAYWNSLQVVDGTGKPVSEEMDTALKSNRFTQAEFNFPLFFGLAIQAYESTLVSDDTPVDRFAEGQTSSLTNSEVAGMRLFIGRTGCNTCHAGAETTLATHEGVNSNDPLNAGRDTGYFYIGVRPLADDIGLGGTDGFGKPLASRFPSDDSPASARGRFKTPGIRNVEFTGPYLHNGSQATLKQVMEFYDRAGDFPANASNGPNIRAMALSPTDQADLVAFMKALTDDRVRFERAPFDHPELCVPDGHVQNGAAAVMENGNPAFPLSAADRWVGIPAVGRSGNSVPLQTFEELLAGIGSDGSRAHHMNQPCAIEAVTATGFVAANAASFRSGVLGQDSIVSAFGTSFPADSAVEIHDADGTVRSATVVFASEGQVNFLVPEGTAIGPATIIVKGGRGSFQHPVLIRGVAPGLFGANSLAAANVITFRNGEQTTGDTLRVSSAGAVELAPIDLGEDSTRVFLVLYGTGIRHHSKGVSAQIGNVTVDVAFAGPQGTFAGQDQINIELPRSLKGSGLVDVVLTVDGDSTNAVKILIQ